MRNFSVPSYFVNEALRNVEKYGISRDLLIKKHQIPVSLTSNPDARIPAAQFARLQQDITILLDDEMLGHLEKPLPTGCFAVACRSLINSKSVGIALSRYCQFYTLLDCGLSLEVIREKSLTRIRIAVTDKQYCYSLYAYEATLYYVHRLMNWLGDSPIPLLRVNLDYSAPPHANDYRPLFFATPVFFDQPHTEIVLHTALLKSPVAQNPRSLSRFLPVVIYELLTQDPGTTLWSNKISLLLQKNLASPIEMEEVAAKFALHPQTLRRRLQREGVHFQDIKNAVRRDFAIDQLTRTRQSIENIAAQTGFSEPSTFIRAFKSWTGMTPLGYRKTE